MADLSLESLYRKSYNSTTKQIADEIFRSVKHQMQEASKAGGNEVYYDLPENLVAGNLELSDVQLIVYSDLIERFDVRGFKVEFIKSEDASILHVSWPSQLDPTERRRMTDIIKTHLKLPNKKQ